MDTIDSYQFGEIVISGKKYLSDVIIFHDRVIDNWWRKTGHELCPDDITEVFEGNPEVLGKPVGSDEAHQKATGPSVLGLQQAKTYAEELVDYALAALRIFGKKGQPLAALARYIIERNK